MIRITLHAAVLAVGNLGAILAGFALYGMLGGDSQLTVQIPAAVILSVAGFAAWMALCHRGPLTSLRLEIPADGRWIYLAAIPWAMLIFVPLHCFTQGYLTAPGNLIALGKFQLLVNLVAVYVGVAIARRARHQSR